MAHSPPRHNASLTRTQHLANNDSKMAMIVVPTPPPSSAFNKDRWEARSPDYPLPRGDSKPVALPSIRQAIPELHLATNIDHQGRLNSYHPQSWTPAGPASSEYIHSPTSKRRRISNEEEKDSLRTHQVPRLYPSPERPASSHISPHSQRPPTADDSWRSQAPVHYCVPSVSPEFAHRERHASVHSLPPPPGMERSCDAYYTDEYTTRQRMESQPPTQANRSPIYTSQTYDYNGRCHPMSAGSARPEDRSPFAPSRYSMPHQDAGRYGDVGMMGMGGDAKQRKRRGNLPKETTDKLRSWFVAHLQHPYPTEDEKQELMRQTGLQMNQISNWFINARRRQLPAMINNARAETDAMHSRAAADGASIGSTDRSEMDARSLDRESTYDASPRMHGVTGLKRD